MHFTTERADEVEVTQDAELVEAVRLVRVTESDSLAADERCRKAKDALVALMDVKDLRSEAVSVDGSVYRATVVRSERTKIDDEGLRKAIGSRSWNKLTTRKVDAKLLEKAVISGEVQEATVSRYVTITTASAYPRITKLAGN